jgi:pimeloyl-ACP methyl ester carboxylesterase
MVMHGGPDAGSHSSATRFFDPQRYRVILFDQRGCGKSTPIASEDDATAALTDNTTGHLIDDVSGSGAPPLTARIRRRHPRSRCRRCERIAG